MAKTEDTHAPERQTAEIRLNSGAVICEVTDQKTMQKHQFP